MNSSPSTSDTSRPSSDHRIIYRATGETLEILVVAVGHRRDVYDRLRELVQEFPGLYEPLGLRE